MTIFVKLYTLILLSVFSIKSVLATPSFCGNFFDKIDRYFTASHLISFDTGKRRKAIEKVLKTYTPEDAEDAFITALPKSKDVLFGYKDLFEALLEVGGKEEAQSTLIRFYKDYPKKNYGYQFDYFFNRDLIINVLRESENLSAATIQFLDEISEAEFQKAFSSFFEEAKLLIDITVLENLENSAEGTMQFLNQISDVAIADRNFLRYRGNLTVTIGKLGRKLQKQTQLDLLVLLGYTRTRDAAIKVLRNLENPSEEISPYLSQILQK